MSMISQLRFVSIISLLFCVACNNQTSKPRILVFTKTSGYHHSSIAVGTTAIIKLGNENNFEVDTTSDASCIQEDSLKKYAAVIFLNTTGYFLNNYQQADFERYIQSGGGYVGLHAATDAEYDWGWYGRLVGAYFNGHPEQQEAIIKVIDSANDATKHLPKEWKRKDEWYNFKKLNKDVHVLLAIDEKSYKGGTNGDDHPMAWYHDFDGGRAWYTELGHTEESYVDPLYLKHILGGIKYAIGENKKLDYSKATTQRTPDENRFTKTMLVEGKLFEPTEMTILPNLDVLIVQRRGEVLLYKQETKKLKQVGFLNVYFEKRTPQGSTEEGLLGVQADPDFVTNHFLYIYYSSVDSAVDYLSRFTFTNDTLDLKTEKIILRVNQQREICCHTGGSIAFGKDHTLFLSTGDNSTPEEEPGTSPFNQHSFAPIDDRPGFLQYDSRRGAGNTNDLRGKIIRIKINPDGSYTIPEGNLFAKGTDKTRPEIYTMGNRNPYRISVDKKTDFLYWGEVGPDANNDSLETRGPRGYDEINQARKAGNFGWPYFVGNNFPYCEYDFATGKSGAAFDPQKPVNDSRNNTGLHDLPPAQPAFIWYPYAESTEFPQVGSGGRTAMAGPVYYTDMFPESTRYPEYYNKKIFIYDWIRDWIKVVTMLPNGDFDKMEPFMQHTKLNAVIDMETGPDGRIYLLEYGNGWYAKNPDAGLAVIDYNGGNRPPEISSLKVSKPAGLLPFSGTAKVHAKDPENDAITYKWNLGNGIIKETTKPEVDFNYDKAGDYSISVEAKDDKGAASKSNPVIVYAGNEYPEVSVIIKGTNKSFYLPGKPISYNVSVNQNKTAIDTSDLYVSVDFLENVNKNIDIAGAGGSFSAGKILTQTLDCKSCHKENEKSIGPSFMQVSQKYLKDENATNYLVEKVTKGGSGVWGNVAMSAHPNIVQADSKQIIKYILALSNKEVAKKSFPASGTIIPPINTKKNAALIISATYSNKRDNVKALSSRSAAILPGNSIFFTGKENKDGFNVITQDGITCLQPDTDDQSWFAIDSIDLTEVSSIDITIQSDAIPPAAYSFEIRLDASDGKLLGKGSIKPGVYKDNLPFIVHSKLDVVNDEKYHRLFLIATPPNSKNKIKLNIEGFQFKAK